MLKGSLLGFSLVVAGFYRGAAAGEDDLKYYTRENCEAQGLLPKWQDGKYHGETHFEKIFKSPLAIDLMAAAHSSNSSGFEQVTADWGCKYDNCYGTNCKGEGFYGPGAKDPAGGGCPRGPVKVYEDLVCAIRLGLKSKPNAFENFCDVSKDENLGTFECLSFFANVLTETGSFAETEERDPRPYCWDRSGGGDCCPADDHKPCLADSSEELDPKQYPSPTDRWLTDKKVDKKCCSYHGRGFLQVSYEPNYKALSKALVDDEKVLWHYPYKLDADGVMGWTAALWFWFNKHPAQVTPKKGDTPTSTSPRDEVYNWEKGSGFPGTILVINGAECNGAMTTKRAFTRTSLLFAIAHRLGAKPPKADGEEQLDHYPLPGTDECSKSAWCSKQFLNPSSVCPALASSVTCNSSPVPYLVNASTPMGFNRITIKTVANDGATPICTSGSTSGKTLDVWKQPQADFKPIDKWWLYLDVTRNNICEHMKLYYKDDKTKKYVEGRSDLCNKMCYHEFAWDESERGQTCDKPPLPCATMAVYLSSPTPFKNFESGDMGGYHGGVYYGRVGPGLVMAMNGEWGLGDTHDRVCYVYGADPCYWNVAMGCYVKDENNIHNCRYFHPGVPEDEVTKTLEPHHDVEQLKPGELPKKLQQVIKYYDLANCPKFTGKSVLEQILPRLEKDLDFIFTGHFSQIDGFGNRRYDDPEDKPRSDFNDYTAGAHGPTYVIKRMLCAYLRGVPSDPTIFQRKFGLRHDVDSVDQIPYPLSEDEKRYALLEFAAMASNIMKETDIMGQAEEQDPRCYCNYQGGGQNPCCPNDYGNNPPCYTSTSKQTTKIPPKEMSRGLTTEATCCSYHGRGYLQSSYERNYGDLGVFMYTSKDLNISADEARRFMLNFPQTVDSYGVSGWASTFAFWLQEHPCQYCDGKNTTTVDWNAHTYSPHKAMQKYDTPGQGLGLTYTIINGQECEDYLKNETDISWEGGQMRLSFFYNIAHRLKLKAPGEDTILPLPGTVECDASPFCQGTFGPANPPKAKYRKHGGGCWLLTPQPVDDEHELWPYCVPHDPIYVTSKLGAKIKVATFTMKKEKANECTVLREFRCGSKKINKKNKPSMFTDAKLKIYASDYNMTSDYDDPMFDLVASKGYGELCNYVKKRGPLAMGHDCYFWCSVSAGAASCKELSMDDCSVSPHGLSFVRCANRWFKTTSNQCEITVAKGETTTTPKPTPPPPCQKGCKTCKSKDGQSYNDQHCSKCNDGASSNEWPCKGGDNLCKCADSNDDNKPTKKPDDKPTEPKEFNGCDKCECIGKDFAYQDSQCSRCSNGQNKNDWPCNSPASLKQTCKCK